MITTIPARELHTALTGLAKVTPRKATLPILQGVLIEAAGNTVRLTSTDLESTVSYTVVNAAVTEPGLVIVADAKRLRELVSQAAKDNAVISTADTLARIRLQGPLGARESMLAVADPAEWPLLPAEIPVQDAGAPFTELYRTLLPFASTDETRYVLNGVAIDVDKTGTHMVATDGKRLAAFSTAAMPVPATVILPHSKFLSWTQLGAENRIGVSKEGMFRLVSGPWSYTTKLIDGQFPNWRQVVPRSAGANGFEVAEADLRLVEDAVRTLPGGNDGEKGISLSAHAGALRLSACDPEVGWSHRDLPNSPCHGEGTAVNRSFLLDAVRAGFTQFRWQDGRSPLLSTTKTGRHVLMPLRLEVDVPKSAAKEAAASTKSTAAATGQPATVAEPSSNPEPVNPTQENPVIQPKETKPVIQMKPPVDDPSSAEQLWLAFQNVRDRVRDLNTALTTLGDQIRAAKTQDRTIKAELANARGVLAKLQSIAI